jgi:hypothetical protein
MTNFEFLVWLLGFLELCDPQPLTRTMLYIIRNHGNLVKAVEKDGLGPLNTEIYDMVSDALDDESQRQSTRLFDALTEKVRAYLGKLQ